jgi:competence protein ComEC
MILAWIGAAFVAGVALGSTFPALVVPFLVLAGLLTVVGAVMRGGRWLLLIVIGSAFCLGVARSPHPGAPGRGDLAYYLARVVQVQGVIDAEPDIRDTGANYEVAVDSISPGRKALDVSGAVWIHTSRAVQLDYGDRVTATGRLLRSRYSPFNRSVVELRFPRLRDAGPVGSGPFGWVVPLRQHLEDGVDRWLPEPEAALLIAITLGARSASLGDVAPALIATGLIHLIAISGIKVALVAGTVHQLARTIGSRLVALVSSLSVLAVYVLITGLTISGLRSALMWSLIFIATYLGRTTLALVSLSFVAALMVAADPTLVSNLSFLLSTVGTFSIVALTPVFLSVLYRLPAVLRPRPLPEALATTLAAQLGTVPIVIVGFHVVSVSAPLANMLVLPLLPALILLGFALGVLGGIPAAAAPLAALSYVLLHAVVQLAEKLSGLPATIPSGRLGPALTVAYYLLLVGVSATVLRRANWAPVMPWHTTRRELSLTTAIACALLSASLAFARREDAPRLYWLGSGDAIVLRAPAATAIFGGSARSQVLLERLGVVVPSRQRTLDLLVADDSRAGSLSSFADLLRHYEVSEVLDVGAEYPTRTYARWRSMLGTRRIPAYVLRTGVAVRLGSVRVEAIAPDAACDMPEDCAAMLRLTVGGRSVLLAGSASVREQREAVFRNVHLKSDVLVCPLSRCDPVLVSAVRPKETFSPEMQSSGVHWRALPADSISVISP